MRPITKLVVGVDFSDESERAVKQAVSVARLSGAAVVLVHVGIVAERAEQVPPSMQATTEAYYQVLATRTADDRNRLDELRNRLSGQGVEVSQVVVDGFADDGIVDAADRLGADLIVVGTHGRTGLTRFLLGSVAEKVVRRAHTSVLVARGEAAAAGGFQRIVVGTDFSPLAEAALTRALGLAAPGAQVDVVHCWTLAPIAAMPEAGIGVAGVGADLAASMQAATEEQGAELLRRHAAARATLRFHALEASPADGLDSWASRVGADLLAVSSHGRRGVRRLLLGSVAEVTVRHAPCSVLVVR